MDKTMLTAHIIGREFAWQIWKEFGLENPPHVYIWLSSLGDDLCKIEMAWQSIGALVTIPRSELQLSIDEFGVRWIVPAIAEACGRPLMDGGYMVINPVHDSREPA